MSGLPTSQERTGPRQFGGLGVIHPSALQSPWMPFPAYDRPGSGDGATRSIGSRVLDPRERRVVGAACALWFGHRCLSRSMRLEEGMNLAHRQGNSFLGLFPGEYAHFRFRGDLRSVAGYVALGETTGWRSSLWLQADVVVHGAPEPLLAAQVPFCRLHRNVAQQELNLFKLSSGGVAQPRAGATTIVGR
jgi:hypothetical protein